jgi:hypothetical protein
MSLPEPRMTAVIITGVTTNRVVVKRQKRQPKPVPPKPVRAVKPPPPPRPVRVAKPRPSKGRYRTDKSLTGQGTETRCICAPPTEWTEIDKAAQSLMMSRSEFLRRGARVLITQVGSGDGSGAHGVDCTLRSVASMTALGGSDE